MALGYDAGRREFFYARQIYTWSPGPDGRLRGRTITVVGFAAGKPRVVDARARQRDGFWLDSGALPPYMAPQIDSGVAPPPAPDYMAPLYMAPGPDPDGGR